MSRRTWVVAVIAEVLALNLAFFLWTGAAMSGPRVFASNTPGNMAAFVTFMVCAAVTCLLVPGWSPDGHGARRGGWSA